MKRAVSLILILSLILAIFAIPAQASAVGTGILITVSAASAISAALIGLGVMPGSDGTTFDGIVSGAADYLASLGFGDGVGFPVLKYFGTGGVVRYALESAAMIALRSWLFDQDVVSSGYTTLSATGSIYGNCTFVGDNPFGVVSYKYTNRYYNLVYALVPSLVSVYREGSSSAFINFNLNSYYSGYYYAFDYSYDSGAASSSFPYYGLIESASDELAARYVISTYLSGLPISSPYDVTLGDVAAPDTALVDAYPDWAVDSVQVDPGGDDEDPVPYIPIGLGDTLEDVLSSSQEDVQSGVSSLETPNEGTEVNISGDVGGSLTPDGGGSGDLPSGDGAVTVDDLTTMFAWLAVRIDEAVQSLFPDLQVIKTYLKTIAQWHETENVKYDSMLSYFSGWDTDFDTMLTNLSNIDLNLTTLVDHAGSSVDLLSAIASDVQDIRDVIADPLDGDINEQEQDNKNAFLNTFSKKSQADNIGDLSGLSDGFTEWFSLDVDPSLLFDQMDIGFTDWFTSETAQAISVGGGAAATGISLMDDAEYEDPETPYLDAWDQEVQNILSGGDGEW